MNLIQITTALVLLLATPLAFSQAIHWGVKGGTPLNHYFRTAPGLGFEGINLAKISFGSNVNRYTVGPAVDIDLPLRLEIEAGMLYKRQNFFGRRSFSTRGPMAVDDVVITQRTSVNSWEFPILLKYSLSGRPAHPFVDWGASFKGLSGARQVVTTTRYTTSPPTVETPRTEKPPELRRTSNVGLVMGTGVEFRLGYVRISPEFRTTLWGQRNFRSYTNMSPNGLLESRQDQIEFLLGIAF